MKRRTVSLCMIARDEEASIGLAIKSALALVDEVVVVDTGSRDNTRIIAEGYGARIVDFSWRDDFAAARNAALEEAFGDWVLVLDADERLQPLRPIDFQRLLNAESAAAYRIELAGRRLDAVPPGGHPVRLFRNHAEIRYRSPVHEQILPTLQPWAEARGLTVEDAPIIILHTGALRDRRAEKRDRNLRILRRAAQEQPAEPYFEYQLASESLVMLDDEVLPVAGLGQTLATLQRAWQKLAAQAPAAPPWGPDLAAKIACTHIALGATTAALADVEAGRRLFGPHPALSLAGIAAAARRLDEAAAALPAEEVQRLVAETRGEIDALLAGRIAPGAAPVDERALTLYPLRYRGELALLAGQVDLAAESFEKALTIDGGYSSAWLGLAECARYAGDRKRALQLYLRAVTASEWNHRAWLRGGSILDELGFHDNAASWRRQVAIHFPEHPAHAGSDDEAGVAARPVPQTT